MNNPKILVAVGHGLYEPWINILHEGQGKTWLRWPLPEGMKVIHFHGTPLSFLGWKLDRLHEKIRWTNRWVALPLAWFDRIVTLPFKFYIPQIRKSILLNVEQDSYQVLFPDSYLNFRWKVLSFLEYFVQETDFKYLFFTTTSSMMKPEILLERIFSLPENQPIYAGVKAYAGANFAAGNCRLLSRSAAILVLQNCRHFDAGYIEDRAMGNLMEKIGIPFIELPSLNISSIEELDRTSDKTLNSHFHIRVKSGSFKSRNDVEIMHAVYQRINAIAGEI
jgi:hypothetical protein